ncbi:MAG: 4-hydroxybenzoate octaprenyltransferase [Candidatus Eremiobacteraeota bacterium]|nr:4-hydroxybenzoate octaprenyltransferase [Candidatus Eremiobacteraeota bacterium]
MSLPSSVRLFLRDIRIEHTLFALPFAYVGAVLAARGTPTFTQLAWITLAVLGARTAAMAANRYFDREIDAVNPRTANRALASGALSPRVMIVAAVAGMILLLVAASQLNVMCLALAPIAAVAILAYPLCKRVTWGSHFVLGAIDGLAPLGAFIAISGTVTWAALALFVAVTLWVAGFDVIYALMDREVDLSQGLRSIPARFGAGPARSLAIGLHLGMIVLLAAAGAFAGAGAAFYLGVALAAVLAWYEQRLFGIAKNLFVLNERVFVSNMVFSVAFLCTTLGGFALRR